MYNIIKRIFDLFCVFISFPIWLPVMTVLAIIIKATSKGPVFFKQKRYGLHKQFFMIYKFRSMYVEAPKDVPTHLLENPNAFITPIGRFMRKLSLDEVPQIINIIKGELSLVGPRPALWNQYDLMALRDQYGANDVPVGLTGLAQVRGRDELPLDVKAHFDGDYVQKRGFFYDVWILILTVWVAVTGHGNRERS